MYDDEGYESDSHFDEEDGYESDSSILWGNLESDHED